MILSSMEIVKENILMKHKLRITIMKITLKLKVFMIILLVILTLVKLENK